MQRRDLIKAVHLLTNGRHAAEARANPTEAEVFYNIHSGWRDRKGIVGFGVGKRTVGGQATRELVLKVYVIRKLSTVDVDAFIPATLDVPGVTEPVPTDIDEIGDLKATGFSGRVRPVLGGMRIQGPDGALGTLGCLVHRAGDMSQQFILTAGHVVAPPNIGRKYKFVQSPVIAASGSKTANAIAAVNQQTVFKERFLNRYDAAIARVIDDNAAPNIRNVGRLAPGPAVARVEMPVSLCGAICDQQRGVVVDTDLAVKVGYRGEGGSFVTYGFTNQLLCRMFTAEGDSGAILMDDELHPIGINIAGTGAYSVVSPIGPLLKDWGLAVTTANALPSSTEATPNTQPWTVQPDAARDVLARTLWGEAEGEGSAGQRAVAAVIVNRTKRPTRFATTVEGVCRQKNQFSCWNAGARRERMLAVDETQASFRSCVAIADETLEGRLQDPTNGAEFYHEKSTIPSWAVGHTPCVVIGRHWFYNDVS